MSFLSSLRSRIFTTSLYAAAHHAPSRTLLAPSSYMSAARSFPMMFTQQQSMQQQQQQQQIRGVKTKVKGYKIKTHTGAAARWRKTKSGKYKHASIGKNHGNSNWSRSIRSRNHTQDYAHGNGEGNHVKRIRKLMPYA
ncbi:hypothetical protein BZA70DRAFT_291723 [Myxozyma melibiosi]|uniref:50S ribosomal protein L35 n=1 Tax=Myxozyma melibiosi TaxID=54550 RepID=A0ABR1EZ87_9ASCO